MYLIGQGCGGYWRRAAGVCAAVGAGAWRRVSRRIVVKVAGKLLPRRLLSGFFLSSPFSLPLLGQGRVFCLTLWEVRRLRDRCALGPPSQLSCPADHVHLLLAKLEATTPLPAPRSH